MPADAEVERVIAYFNEWLDGGKLEAISPDDATEVQHARSVVIRLSCANRQHVAAWEKAGADIRALRLDKPALLADVYNLALGWVAVILAQHTPKEGLDTGNFRDDSEVHQKPDIMTSERVWRISLRVGFIVVTALLLAYMAAFLWGKP